RTAAAPPLSPRSSTPGSRPGARSRFRRRPPSCVFGSPPYRAGNDDRTISNALGYLDKNHHPAGSTRPAGPGADTPLVTTHGHRQGGFHGELATVDYASPPVPR